METLRTDRTDSICREIGHLSLPELGQIFLFIIMSIRNSASQQNQAKWFLVFAETINTTAKQLAQEAFSMDDNKNVN